MKTLALKSGDLVLGSGGHATVSGSKKIIQEVSLALSEVLGADKFHDDLGSILETFFGEPINDTTEAAVRSEVFRVVNMYIAVQQQQVLKDHLEQRQSRFDASDVVTAINNVDVSISYDSIAVKIYLTTNSGQTLAINRTVIQ